MFRPQRERVNEHLVDAHSWEAESKPYIRQMMSTPGSKEWWDKNKASFPDAFVSEVDEFLHQV